MWAVLTGILSGALMSIQGVFNTQITRQTGLWVAAGWAQLTAFLVCAVAWLITGRQAMGNLWSVDHRYMLTAGLIGAGITITVVKSIGGMGPAKATMLILTAQLVMSYIIQVSGMFGVEKQPFMWRKLAAVCVIIGGIIFFQWE